MATSTQKVALNIRARLDELRQLTAGWADGMQAAADWGSGYGKAPSPAGLDWLAAGFHRHYPDYAPLPCLYPTPEGGVQAEWSLGPQDISLEVNLATGQAWWHRLDLSTDNDAERDLTLDAAGWQWLVGELLHWAKQAE